MNDIFSSGLDDSSDIFAGEQGSTPSGEPSGGNIIPPETTDQVEPDAAQPLEQPSDTSVTAGDQGQADGDVTGQASSGADASQPSLTEADIEKLQQDAEAALNDERTPKWFKNVVANVYKPKLQQYQTQVEQYSSFGAPEEVSKRMAMFEALNEVRSDPNTGMPMRTTENFVKSLYEEDPQGAYQLINDLALLPSPITEGLTVTQELFAQMGLDPRRMDDLKQFAQNGYSMAASSFPAPDAEDLALIPQQYHATFAKLDPETRNSLLSDPEHVRDGNLEAHRIRLEQQEWNQSAQERQQQEAQQREEQQQAAFRQQVEAKGVENFTKSAEAVLNSFVESLTKQANLPQMDALMISNTVLNALEPTLAGRMSVEALKAEGIEIDPQIPQIIGRLEELSKHAAYYQQVNDQENLTKTVGAITEQQERLTAKGNKVVAALALKRNGTRLAPAQKLQGQVAAVGQTQRHALAGTAATGVNTGTRPRMDFSEESYLEDLQNDPHFRR